LAIDDTGFPKQGTRSVGVQRHCGALGEIGNCPVAVSSALVADGRTWPLAYDYIFLCRGPTMHRAAPPPAFLRPPRS
jgi:hypothetical protein